MADQVMIQVRMDSALKDEASEVFEKMGMDMSTAVRMFFKAAVREQRLPFSTSVGAPAAREETEAEKLMGYMRKMVMYEPPAIDDEEAVAVMPLEYGSIPAAMFVQMVTKIPEGKVGCWEDIYGALGRYYGMPVRETPRVPMPIMDADGDDIPYWRIVSSKGILGGGRGGSREAQKDKLMEEGIPVVQRGKIEGSYKVENYRDYFFDFNTLKAVNTK